MKTVGIRELKNKLSEYVREVRVGETVLITDRGEVVAELGPPGERRIDPSIPAGLIDMAKKGLVTLAQPKGDYTYPILPRLMPDGSAAELLNAERGER